MNYENRKNAANLIVCLNLRFDMQGFDICRV